MPEDKEGEPRLVKGTTLFLFEHDGMRLTLGHFFHLLEHIVGIWSFDGHQNFREVENIVLACDGRSDLPHLKWAGPNKLNKNLLSALFPKAEVLTWEEVRKKFKGEMVCFEKAITSDRYLTY